MNNNSRPPAYVVKVENGRAIVYDAYNGRRINGFSGYVISAHISGDCAQCNLANGRIEVRDIKTGNLLSSH
jgi:hypothetical protein